MMEANFMSRTGGKQTGAGDTPPVRVADVLRAGEERFREMTDAQGRLTYFNPAAVRLAGRVPVLGTDQWCVAWKILLPDGTPVSHDESPMAMVLKGGLVTPGGEYIAERQDGSRFWFSPYPSAVRDGEGRITGGINMLVTPLPPVRVHSTHLRQLFQNLIGNAIKYRSPERAAAVHVNAERQSGFWVFTVSDNGVIRFFERVDRDPATPPPDLVILDINLPKWPGSEVLEQMRQSTRSAKALVVVVTSSIRSAIARL
jgi:CheY-like chemotaxis protein